MFAQLRLGQPQPGDDASLGAPARLVAAAIGQVRQFHHRRIVGRNRPLQVHTVHAKR
jgi:hypothetical protein